MDAERMSYYHDLLMKRRRGSLRTAERLDQEREEITGKGHFDWVDQAWDESEARVMDRLSDTVRIEVQRIDQALNRIDAGVYGVCRGCRQVMEESRLETSPEAEFCRPCQEMREELERV
jgi:DnaK suppressor protein